MTDSQAMDEQRVWFVLAVPVGVLMAIGPGLSVSLRLIPIVLAGALLVTLCVLGLRAIHRGRSRRTLMAALAGSIALVAVMRQVSVLAWVPERRTQASRQLTLLVRPGVPVALGPSGRDQISFRLDRVAVPVNTAKDAASFAATPTEKYVIVPPAFMPRIRAAVADRAEVLGVWRTSERDRAVLCHVAGKRREPRRAPRIPASFRRT